MRSKAMTSTSPAKPPNDPQLAGEHHPAADPRGRDAAPEPIAADLFQALETVEMPSRKRPAPGV
jgi:hypothetical protein